LRTERGNWAGYEFIQVGFSTVVVHYHNVIMCAVRNATVFGIVVVSVLYFRSATKLPDYLHTSSPVLENPDRVIPVKDTHRYVVTSARAELAAQ